MHYLPRFCHFSSFFHMVSEYSLVKISALIFEKHSVTFDYVFAICLSWKAAGAFTLRKKCLYSELFWSAFSRIHTEYGETRSISPYSVQMQENADQNISEYGHFSRSVNFLFFIIHHCIKCNSITVSFKYWVSSIR